MGYSFGKRRVGLDFHPSDFEAIQQASNVANVDATEFCKLAIHVVAQNTLAGEWPPRLRGAAMSNAEASAREDESGIPLAFILACENGK